MSENKVSNVLQTSVPAGSSPSEVEILLGSELEFFGHTFKDKHLCIQALTHKSYLFDGPGRNGKHNETLEFLGDAVLDLALSQILMKAFPESQEGVLSKKRASLVNETVLAGIASSLKLGERMLLGKGEIISAGTKKPRLLASVYEALIGAIFTEAGYEKAYTILESHFEALVREQRAEDQFEADYKTKFQEIVQADLKCGVSYRLTSETGPSHEPIFESAAIILEREVTRGVGKTKKASEQAAAKKGIEDWGDVLLSFGVRKK